jgi:flagellum-specific peptidoglycan hydrolase FlgJ
MTPTEFLTKALQAANDAGHIWPGYAAAESALESGWGNSRLAQDCNNLFGQKSGHTSTQYPQKAMPTHEWVKGKLVPATAYWPVFPDWKTCFAERMNLLQSMPKTYGAALAANSGPDFVVEVSKAWATDPLRAKKVLDTYMAHRDVLEPVQPENTVEPGP